MKSLNVRTMCRIWKIITFLEFLSQDQWSDILLNKIQALLFFDPIMTLGVILKPHISKCSMMPEWHQLVPMSGHVKESETAKILQLYTTSILQVHSFVCQLDYVTCFKCTNMYFTSTFNVCMIFGALRDKCIHGLGLYCHL